MKLVCHIGDLEGLFDIVQGATFSEDYNETLDSGNIIIVSKNRQLDIKPYDDVIIFDSDSNPNGYVGWGNGISYSGFYRHLLIDNFSEEMIYQGGSGVGDNNINTVDFKYKISLFSETKKLEKIIVPRLSITQPLKNDLKKSILYYFESFLDLYNPKVKVWKETSNNWRSNWEYRPKYSYQQTGVDSLEFASNIWCPEFTLGESNLRELLTELFQVADRIPYVKDDKIYALDISKTVGTFDKTKGQLNFPVRSMTSADYCTNLRTTYSDALPQEYSGHSIEYIGFRNSDEAVLTLDNMRVELSFPIYKINHVYMHYYKTAQVTLKLVDENDEQVGNPQIEDNFPVLITQDITKLVKMNNEPLSKDWSTYANINSIDEAAKYDFSTVRYAQGSRYITGWGEKYQYPVGAWYDTQTQTHIGSILSIVDRLNGYGILSPLAIRNQIEEKILSRSQDLGEGYKYKIVDFNINQVGRGGKYLDSVLKNFFGTSFSNDNFSDTLKDVLFTVDYQPFYNGSIIHSKGYGDVNENLTSIDNPNNSLSLLERDGIAQREKLERFGVQAIQINARYTDINHIQNVGVVYTSPYVNDISKDLIIYHREYSIFDNVINCTYFGSQEYVLKNYYTSVFSKYRVYNLMSYGESVRRTENEKYYIYLSESDEEISDIISGSLLMNRLKKLWLSGILPTLRNGETPVDARDNVLNNAYYYVEKYKVWSSGADGHFELKSNGYFATDFMAFSTGNSLVLNASMVDNIVGGTYWERTNVRIDWFDDTKDDLRGNPQNQYYIANTDDGTIYSMKFGFTHKDDIGLNSIIDDSGWSISANDIIKRPLLTTSEIESSINQIEVCKTFNKDNKELIDFSLQFEFLCGDNIFISPWFGRLNDLITNFYKQKEEKSLLNVSITSINSLYLGLTYEKSWAASGTTYSTTSDYSNFGCSINYAGNTESRYPNLDLGYLGFGHRYAYPSDNFHTAGEYYLGSEFYKYVTGLYPSDNSINVSHFKFTNPVLIFAIDKTTFDNIANGESVYVNYDYANFHITWDDTNKRGNGNPYRVGSLSLKTLQWIDDIVVSVKRINITKGSSKTAFIKETTERIDKSIWTDTIMYPFYTSQIQLEHMIEIECMTDNSTNRKKIADFYDEDLGCCVFNMNIQDDLNCSNTYLKGLTTDSISNFSSVYPYGNVQQMPSTYKMTISGDPSLVNYYEEFTVDSGYSEINRYINNLRNHIKDLINYDSEHNGDLYLVFVYEISYRDTNTNAEGTYRFISFDNTVQKVDIATDMNESNEYILNGYVPSSNERFRSYKFSELRDYIITKDSLDTSHYIEFDFKLKTDSIIYTDGYRIEQRGGNANTLGVYNKRCEETIQYSYDDELLENYMDTVISYTIHSDDRNYDGQTRTISKRIPLTIDSRAFDDFYIFKGAIRTLDDFNPLQLDLKSDDATGVINSNATMIDIFGSETISNINNWKSEVIDESSTTTTDGYSRIKLTRKGYPKMMLDALKSGVAGDIISSFSSIVTGNALADKLQNDGESFNISSISSVLVPASTGEFGYYRYRNLYYYLYKGKLDPLFQYTKYTLSGNGDFLDVTDYCSCSIENDGTLVIRLTDDEYLSGFLSNQAHSFVVFYKSNESLGVWDGAGSILPANYSSESNMHFVFGINYKYGAEDSEKRNVRIKPSLLRSRDRRVFDKEHRLKGNIDEDN